MMKCSVCDSTIEKGDHHWMIFGSYICDLCYKKSARQLDMPDATHYDEGGISTIDIIKAKIPETLTPFQAVCWGNVIKYMTRMGLKEGPSMQSDAKKALDYLTWLVEDMSA